MDTRKDENELHLLGGSTVYKQDYAPEVLEAFTNKHQGNDIRTMITGYASTVRNLQASVRSPASRTLQPSTSIIFPI